jgi:Flp pilus assembly secretin CpaC
VPVVGRIPLLGMPFRKRRNEVNVTTLLVFVSPTIVDLRHLSEESSSALNFWRERGTEWVSTQRIDAEIEAMQDEL